MTSAAYPPFGCERVLYLVADFLRPCLACAMRVTTLWERFLGRRSPVFVSLTVVFARHPACMLSVAEGELSPLGSLNHTFLPWNWLRVLPIARTS